MKTLVIEDSRTTLKILCSHLERMGITPIPAETGLSGIDLFQKERPDLVLLDIVMPDVDGFEVARKIRQLELQGQWTPIIFLSALTKDQDIERGIAAGGDDYILKPVSEIVLGAKIRAMLRIIQMRQSLLVLTQKLDAANQELRRLTSLDGLTGIANRRHFDNILTREWQRAMRRGDEVAILMCDIDFFKLFNDTYGHQNGDACLIKTAHALTACIERGGDLVARYGGEEFVAILPGTTLEGAVHIADQMRLAVQNLSIPHPSSPFGFVTASLGVASGVAMPETSPNDLIHAADQALYKAKHGGRNRVCQTAALAPES
ncbi:GGDEF domain-containing response regulator [Propionivibrio limicola]|uniref:GGDEF domain-containing response regulator n=1 Tax=Propionivibrio limicola TaxID=167645 RepID=UPI001290E9DE|nr:diguanylate cyclase [Propionivibrio limicola]